MTPLLAATTFVLAIAPLAALALAVIAGGAVALFIGGREGEKSPPDGTLVMMGRIGDLDVEVHQQTYNSLQWSVSRDGLSQGAGAGTYDQDPIEAMVEFAFSLVPADASVSLTFTAEGAVGRAKEHGSITATVDPTGMAWHWTVADDKHGVFGIGEQPSRGRALLSANDAIATHVGMALEGIAPHEALPPAPPPPPAPGKPPVEGGGVALPPAPGPKALPQAHGVSFDGCNVKHKTAAEWYAWAQPRVVLAFENASGWPSPEDLFLATVGVAMDEADAPACSLSDVKIEGKSWAQVEQNLNNLLTAIQDDSYLYIPAPDEMIAGALGGFAVANVGHKERYKGYAIVVRPADGGFDWWIFEDARLFDSLADASGHSANQASGINAARAKVDDLIPDGGPGGIVLPGGVLEASGEIGNVTIEVRQKGTKHEWTIDSPAIAAKHGEANTEQAAARAALLAASAIAAHGAEVNLIAEDNSWWVHVEITAEALWDWSRSDGVSGSAPTRKAAIEEMFA